MYSASTQPITASIQACWIQVLIWIPAPIPARRRRLRTRAMAAAATTRRAVEPAVRRSLAVAAVDRTLQLVAAVLLAAAPAVLVRVALVPAALVRVALVPAALVAAGSPGVLPAADLLAAMSAASATSNAFPPPSFKPADSSMAVSFGPLSRLAANDRCASRTVLPPAAPANLHPPAARADPVRSARATLASTLASQTTKAASTAPRPPRALRANRARELIRTHLALATSPTTAKA
jgi:hypothetical protein